MARQYQVPGGPFINAEQDGREYQLSGYGYFNDESAAAAAVFVPLISAGSGPGMQLAAGRGLAG